MKILGQIAVLAALLAAAGGGVWYWQGAGADAPQFRTAEVTRGNLDASISATGTIEPEEVVDVGAQVAGKIQNLGIDPADSTKTIDYGSAVEEGTILAQIDDAIYKTQVAQARANLQRSEADLSQLQARLFQRERDWQRAQSLHAKNANSEQDYDLARAEWEAAKSALAVGKAAVEQARSSLDQAEINLGYTTIKSPVKGVIIDRRMNIGQTVVASLNAPSLFLIAKDLGRLQVWAAVNEADVGQIHPGQNVTFTVDAYPDQTFHGQVLQTRLNATMTQNVVTYTVVVTTDNSDGKLLPYLTANLDFDAGSRSGVLVVPNSALRYRPATRLVAPEYRAELDARGGGGRRGKSSDPKERNNGRVWVADGHLLRPVSVKLGLADSGSTEIVAGDLKEGDQIVTGDVRQDTGGDAKSPFTPQMFGGAKRPPQ
ncbi:MAG: efflux RND transporter periplasmic adaptor subunit [Planctomycetia bacterium]|nr:efflux RND transporter periplasmic adaptor subunit [Planctomycetia bacterium]